MSHEDRHGCPELVGGVRKKEPLLLFLPALFAEGTEEQQAVYAVEREDPRPDRSVLRPAGVKLDRCPVRRFVEATKKIRVAYEKIDALPAVLLEIEMEQASGPFVQGDDARVFVEGDDRVGEHLEKSAERRDGERPPARRGLVAAPAQSEDLAGEGGPRARSGGQAPSALEDGRGARERHPQAQQKEKGGGEKAGERCPKEPADARAQGEDDEGGEDLPREAAHGPVSSTAGGRIR
jgi:hypothetical protein